MNDLANNFKLNYQNAVSNSECVFQGSNYRITVLTERLLRLEYSKNGIFVNDLTETVSNRLFPKPEFSVKQDTRILEITTKYFTLKYVKEKPFEGMNIEVFLLNTDKIWNPKQKEVRNYKTTGNGYINNKLDFIKGLYSGDGFATLNDSNSLLLSEEGFFQMRQNPSTDIYLFMYKRDFGYCLRDYFMLTGYPLLIPRYALGVWWNKKGVYTFDSIKQLVKNFQKNQIPLSVFLFDDNWHLKDRNAPNLYKTGYTFNRNLIPDPSYFLNYMHENGVRVGLQIDPSEGIMPHEDGYDAIAHNIGLTNRGTIPFNVFDKSVLFNYFNILINPLKQGGIDFFWIDYSKPQSAEASRALNYYHYRNELNDINHRNFMMTRNICRSSHRYGTLYSGSNIVSWKTLEEIPFYNSLASNIGLSWWSHDIGGTNGGIEQSELYIRYVELGCFSPIFRFSSNEGRYYKREPWAWDNKTLSVIKDYTQLRHRLIPYLYTENYNYHKTGLPLIQPIYYSHPEIIDEPLYKNEYFFGTQLLVAPITSEKDLLMNRSVKRIFLPNGIWYDFKTGKKFIGNKRYVTFFKEEDYPIFARQGAIIPLQDLEDNLNSTALPKSLEIHIFPGKSNIYKLYEDDGVTSLYKDGYYLTTAIDYNYLQNSYTVIIHPIEGKSGIIPPTRDYKIRFRNTREADNVTVYQDKDTIEKTCYVDDTDFVVSIKDVSTTSQLTVYCKGKDIEIDAVRLINEDIDSIISDLQIETYVKEKLANIVFSDLAVNRKRIAIKKMKKDGLDSKYINMILKMLEYASEI